MPKISVIVPVYKVEDYLDRCVQSILNQSYTDFELILVDDGSPDNCGVMCDAWAAKDRRIKVVHKENGGLSDARNAGVRLARGGYITFIDSDDYIHPQMLQALFQATQSYSVKVAACGYTETRGEALPAEQLLTAELWEPEPYYTDHCTNATVAWGKLYHKSAVLPYPKGKIHEDEYVTYRILFSQERIAIIPGGLYGYYQNPQGLTKVAWNEKRMDVFGAYEERVEYFRSTGRYKLAQEHAMGYIWNVQRQMKDIEQLEPKSRRKYRKRGREYLKRAIRLAEKVTDISPESRLRMYEGVYPTLIPLLRPAQWCCRAAAALGRRLK